MPILSDFKELVTLKGVTGSTVTYQHRIPQKEERLLYDVISYVDDTTANADVTYGVRDGMHFIPFSGSLNLAAGVFHVWSDRAISLRSPERLEIQITGSVDNDVIRIGIFGRSLILDMDVIE